MIQQKFLTAVFFIHAAVYAQRADLQLTPKAFQDKLKATKEAVLIDVRTPGEFSQGFIEGARNVDFRSSGFQEEVEKIEKTKPCFVYCLSGGRSAAAADYMRKNGFKEVYELKGGILAWQNEKLPLIASGNVQADKISAEEYNKMISGNSVLVDFYAPWCAPCRKMEPWLNEISKEYAGKARVVRINIDENKQLARQLGISEIPVLKIYKNGKETWSIKGLTDKATVVSHL